MPKAITLEMLHAMSLDQRKTLHRNASGLDTPAAHAVLELLAQDDLMPAPKAAPKPAQARKTAGAGKAGARKTPAKPRKPAAAKAPGTKAAVHGRSA